MFCFVFTFDMTSFTFRTTYSNFLLSLSFLSIALTKGLNFWTVCPILSTLILQKSFLEQAFPTCSAFHFLFLSVNETTLFSEYRLFDCLSCYNTVNSHSKTYLNDSLKYSQPHQAKAALLLPQHMAPIFALGVCQVGLGELTLHWWTWEVILQLKAGGSIWLCI